LGLYPDGLPDPTRTHHSKGSTARGQRKLIRRIPRYRTLRHRIEVKSPVVSYWSVGHRGLVRWDRWMLAVVWDKSLVHNVSDGALDIHEHSFLLHSSPVLQLAPRNDLAFS
jgi:hypothetical protein